MTQKQKTMKQQVAHKIMTFNIRFDNPQDGINRWEYRSEGVCERLISYKLDILCLQEALEDQYGDIYNALKISGKYQLISKGREYDPVRDVCFGEACSVLVNLDKYEVVDHGFFWLSQTPDTPGSKGWDADCVRIATWVVLKSKQSTDTPPFLLINTHWDHIGVVARMESAKLIKRRALMIQNKHPSVQYVVFTADMNCFNTSAEFLEMLKPESDPETEHRVEFYETRTSTETLATFTGWDDEYDWVLDHILISNPNKVHLTHDYKVITDDLPDLIDSENDFVVVDSPNSKRKMSDHRPVQILLTSPSRGSSCLLQ